jgi:ParB-like chromosome segregation protein Spo0J
VGRWVTNDEGQHLYISDKGEVLARGPGSTGTATRPKPAPGNAAAMTQRAAAVLRAKAEREGAASQERFKLSGAPPQFKNVGAGRTGSLFAVKPDALTATPAPQLADAGHQVAGDVANTGVRSRLAATILANKRAAEIQAHPEIHAGPDDAVTINPKFIESDPKRFQYKLSTTGKAGVTTQFRDIKTWNKTSAGRLSVWRDPANGQTYVVNGHHRLELAKRLGVDKIDVKYLDAADAKTAMMQGAITNIAEGRGTAIDAGHFFREAGGGRELIERHGIPMTESTAKDGLALAGLHPQIFDKVARGDMPVAKAAIIGGSGLGHEHQLTVLAQANKQHASNAVLRELVDNAKASPVLTVKGRDLFGDTEEEVSLMGHRSRVQASIAKTLSSDKKLFGLVAKSKAAQALEERGRSHIDVEETGKVSSEAVAVMGLFHDLKNRSGPVARELNRAAERLHAGEHEPTVMKDARQAITGHVKNMLEGGAAAFAA